MRAPPTAALGPPCYRVYIPKTRSERTAKAMKLFPHQCPVPKISSVNAAIIAARALAEALTNPAPAAPFYHFGDAHQQAIVDLDKIFESAIAKPALPIIVPPQPAVRTIPLSPLRMTILP